MISGGKVFGKLEVSPMEELLGASDGIDIAAFYGIVGENVYAKREVSSLGESLGT